MNKIALITGGSRGLGRNMALALAERGTDVLLTYHSKEAEARKVVAEIEAAGQRAHALQLDVMDFASYGGFIDRVRQALTEHFGTDRLDYLVNNAGVGVYATFPETTGAQVDSMMDMHFKAPFLMTQAMLPVLNDGGGIVNVSSGLARFSMPGYAAYGAMKAAIESLTRYQAVELGARRIRANVIAPGAIETDFGGGAVRDNQDLNNMLASGTALGRVGLPDDIGGVVAFLCSDDARWINGQRLEASGGYRL